MTKSRSFKKVTAISVIFMIFAGGCGGTVVAPQIPDGSKITLFIRFDEGLKDTMNADQKADQSKLAAWMESDIVRQLNDGGYLTSKIETQNDFIPTHRAYMIVVTIDSYASNEMYSRNETRLGQGVTNLGATVEVFKDNHTLPVSRYSETLVSSRDWTYCAGELNRKMAVMVSERINELF